MIATTLFQSKSSTQGEVIVSGGPDGSDYGDVRREGHATA